MKTRVSTSEERDFCGCTFAISFIRESCFQKPVLDAIHAGFKEWYSITSQVNGFRGIHASNLHKLFFKKSVICRTLKVILREVGLMNFDDPAIPSLEAYFKRCSSQKITHFTGFSMSGRNSLRTFICSEEEAY